VLAEIWLGEAQAQGACFQGRLDCRLCTETEEWEDDFGVFALGRSIRHPDELHKREW
jgi:hypothetical protein